MSVIGDFMLNMTETDYMAKSGRLYLVDHDAEICDCYSETLESLGHRSSCDKAWVRQG